MTTAQDRLNTILPSWYELLTQWSLDGSLVAAATEALVLDGSNAKPDAKGQLQSLLSQWSAKNFKSLPEIVLLSDADIRGAQGAYAASTGTIYLNQEWLLTASDEEIQRVLTEELGHSLDDQLNQVDTQGDEGELFSSMLTSDNLKAEQIKAIMMAEDSGTVFFQGDQIVVEQAVSALTDPISWTFRTGDAYSNTTNTIAISSDNSIVFGVGNFANTFVGKLSSQGHQLWLQSNEKTGSVNTASIATTSDGSLIIGGSHFRELGVGFVSLQSLKTSGVGEGFLLRLDSNGSAEWGIDFNGGGYSYIEDIISIESDDLLIGGSYNYDLSVQDLSGQVFGFTSQGAARHTFISRVDKFGSIEWIFSLGNNIVPGYGTYGNTFNSLSDNPNDSSFVVAGSYSGALNFGTITYYNDWGPECYIAKYDKVLGENIWAVEINGLGPSSSTSGVDIDTLVSGDYILGGDISGSARFGTEDCSSSGSADIFLSRISAVNGEILWTTVAGGSNYDSLSCVIAQDDGTALIAGNFTGHALFDTFSLSSYLTNGTAAYSGFVAKIDSSGNFLWATKIATAATVNDIEVTSTGEIVVSGAFRGSVVLGDSVLVSAGLDDVYLAILQPNGQWLPSNEAPIAVSLVNETASLPENTVTTSRIRVADIQITDDALGTNDVTLTGADAALFETDSGVLYLKAEAALDFETNPSLDVTVSVTDLTVPGSTPVTAAYVLAASDVNEAPSDITLTSSGILENSPGGTVIGTLAGSDPDAGSLFTYALVPGSAGGTDADNGLVDIVGNQVWVKSGVSIDYESNPTLNLNIQVTDNGELTYTKSVTAAVLNVNEAPSDTTAPTVTSIVVQGTAVILTFSENVDATSVPPAAFTVQTVNSKNIVSTLQITAVSLNQNDARQVILTLGGTAPASTVNLRVSYTDQTGLQTTGVVQDSIGNDLASFSNVYADTFITSSTTTLASQYRNLTLTGASNVNGTGNALNNTIIGNNSNNTLSGLAGNDTIKGENGTDILIGGTGGDLLTGGGGNDTFRLALTDSLLANYDKITDFAIGSDRLDGPTAVTAANVKDGNGSIYGVGLLQSFDATAIGNLLNSNSNFAANGASVFTYNDLTAGLRTFVALNNGTATFSASSDAIIEITGYSGQPLTSLAIV